MEKNLDLEGFVLLVKDSNMAVCNYHLSQNTLLKIKIKNLNIHGTFPFIKRFLIVKEGSSYKKKKKKKKKFFTLRK